jgi:hypothetical protein
LPHQINKIEQIGLDAPAQLVVSGQQRTISFGTREGRLWRRWRSEEVAVCEIVEDGIADYAARPVFAQAIDTDEEADVFVQQQFEVGMETICVTLVRDDIMEFEPPPAGVTFASSNFCGGPEPRR